jgi:REP element-mobilizing transposase RayT
MPRTRRIKSETGIYHVVLRGNNKQTIFEDEEDNKMFLITLKQFRKKSGYRILAYCLMGNHVHLLMKTGEESIGQCFRRIGASYVYWYNLKYFRVGHLFQDRFKSEVVETDAYLKAVIRYIHRNPLKAGMVERLEDYSWSSFGEFLGLNDAQLVDKDFVLKLFAEDMNQAISNFKTFNEIDSDDNCMDISNRKRLTDERAIELIKRKFSLRSIKDISNFELEQRKTCLKFLLNEGLSVLQISRITGISRYFIYSEVIDKSKQGAVEQYYYNRDGV